MTLTNYVAYKFVYLKTINNIHHIKLILKPTDHFDINQNIVIILEYNWQHDDSISSIKYLKNELNINIMNKNEFKNMFSLFKQENIQQKSITSSEYVY
jgi:hypothetical protein